MSRTYHASKKAMDSIAPGERVEIVATDAGFARDASAWCATTGNKLIEKKKKRGVTQCCLRKVMRLVLVHRLFRQQVEGEKL